MSKYKLSATLEISVQEAQKIIDDYFIAFPQIKVALQRFGVFGVRNGYIRTMHPYSRVRWFAEHHYYVKDIEDHLSERKYNKVLGEIERASMNMPRMYGHVKQGELLEA
jgi:DNA polymerase I-like protein with 3'-5' exonuclease and polymerase domains